MKSLDTFDPLTIFYLRADAAKRVHVRHYVVSDFSLLGLGVGEVDVVHLAPHLRHLLFSHVQPWGRGAAWHTANNDAGSAGYTVLRYRTFP